MDECNGGRCLIWRESAPQAGVAGQFDGLDKWVAYLRELAGCHGDGEEKAQAEPVEAQEAQVLG